MLHRQILPLLTLPLLLASMALADDSKPQIVYLWPTGHPTLQGTNEKEITNPPDPQPGQVIRQFKNIHNPSIEVFPAPAGKANGTALIVAAGGGHRELNTGTEGYDLKDWLHGLGVTMIVLKYRLAQTPNYKYTVEGEALQDTQRAIRIVRARAKEWNINPSRVGLLGFSAGGALAALADIRFDSGKPDAADPIDRQSCRPDFVGLVYAGWSPMDITAPKGAAPAFLTSAGLDDAFHARQTVEFYNSLFKAEVPVELHIYGHGGHANGIKPRGGIPFGTWHIRFQEWMADLGLVEITSKENIAMKFISRNLLLTFCCGLLLTGLVSSQTNQPTYKYGQFEDSRDIGSVKMPGSVVYDDAKKSYTIAGGGENMWATTDAFHFVWRRVSGDFSIAADAQILGTGGNAHRKAVLIIRQNLDADSPYADAALHGDGLTSLQYRETKGGPTREIQSNVKGPRRLQIEKRGEYVWMSIAKEGEALQSAGGSFRISFTGTFYVGLGVCAHDNNAIEKAVFSNVEIKQRPAPIIESTLETVAIASKDRKVVYTKRTHFEAPNWSRDGKYFLFNQGGRMMKLPVTGGEPQTLDTGFAIRCNNDHGISADGNWLAISDQSQEQRRSMIYVLPVGGGTPRRITQLAPSYWHGWSPDGKTLVYCADRNGNFDVYAIPFEGPSEGKAEKRLTTADGLDDGPEYSPDGQYIYFNSVRTGLMQIWRMKPDGSEQTQITNDKYNNWFAHPSPDGKWLVFVTFEPNVEGHPANKDVMLRLMPVGGGEIQVLAKLFGGQGTINVPSWSPDSKQLAFVSYRLIDP